MTAKMVSKPHRKDSRDDWLQIRVRVMRWVLRVKLAMHWRDFGRLLLSTGTLPIVEDSRRDAFWGAIPRDDNQLVGMNVLGRLLMELRQELEEASTESLRIVMPPPVSHFYLLGEPIGEVGFSNAATGNMIDPDTHPSSESLWGGNNIEAKEDHGTIPPNNPIVSNPTSTQVIGSEDRLDVKMPYPKRLIEVDLPIRRISEFARAENNIRHGHFKTLHMWWARRPLAACRAVLCAMLWPDPADEACPSAFRVFAAELMFRWAREQKGMHTPASTRHFSVVRNHTSAWALANHPTTLRRALLDFLADFSDWERSANSDFLNTARELVRVAHHSLSVKAPVEPLEWPGAERWNTTIESVLKEAMASTPPAVFDPFAGGGSIPLEALRLGAESFASDLNPVAVLLNRMVLELIPQHGEGLADAVREAGIRIKEKASVELAPLYPKDSDGASPIAYIWARTVLSDAPVESGEDLPVEIPLMRGFWLRKKAGRGLALRWVRDAGGRVQTEIVDVDYADGIKRKVRRPILEIFTPKSFSELPEVTVQRGSATCPVTGHTTPVARVREQLKTRRGGGDDARLIAVATLHPARGGREYRLPEANDQIAIRDARAQAEKLRTQKINGVSIVPDEKISFNELRRISIPIYGMFCWGDLFTSRQLVVLATFQRLIGEECAALAEKHPPEFVRAIRASLAIAVSKQADLSNAGTRWKPDAECPVQLLARQAVPMVWDFAESVAVSDSSGSWSSMSERTANALEVARMTSPSTGHAVRCSATAHWLPDDSANVFFTDPPYYDAVPYAYLSDFFYVWLKRCLAGTEDDFKGETVPKDEEIVVDRPHALSESEKDIAFYERELCRAFAEARRVLAPDGIGSIVFASKTTASWEAILNAVINAGWTITASWPIDTEMDTRVSAQGQARLASSVHLVVRPRENHDGSVREGDIGSWREVVEELPRRIAEWMPRLNDEGVVGADAIFACLGPALEIFSRYSRVERDSGEIISLGQYLEHVWAAVSDEALKVIFQDASTAGFEPDARLTAMWLWTISASRQGDDLSSKATALLNEDDDSDDDKPSKKPKLPGFFLETDAVFKLAKGLGAPLEDLKSLVEVIADKARLIPVAERTAYLFGKDQADDPGVAKRQKKQAVQPDLFAELAQEGVSEQVWSEKTVTKVGQTTLDRIHQSMILFAAGRSDAMKRFLVDDGAGRDQKFWGLAQALSALYPPKSDEKRWVDGVLARKKGLGL